MTDQEPTIETGVDVAANFQYAVEHARAAIRVVAAHLQQDLDSAACTPLKQHEKEALIRDVHEAQNMGIEITLNGQKISGLALKKGVTLAWRLLGSDDKGFYQNAVQVSTSKHIIENVPEP